jgi:hypothetical protein
MDRLKLKAILAKFLKSLLNTLPFLFLVSTIAASVWHSMPSQRQIQKVYKPAPIPKEGLKEDGDGDEDVEGRQKWFMFQRTYPFDSIPENARLKAWLSRPKARIDALATQRWRSIGPVTTNSDFIDNWGITSGRINTIAVSPSNSQIILVGGATGGIWRSTDGGLNFVPTSDNQIDLAVGSIAFSKSNSSIVYAGMGDLPGGYLGSGVLKSTNAGQTWTRVSNTSLPSPGTIAKIDVDPTDPNRILVYQVAPSSQAASFYQLMEE